ncbi:MAG: crossover junction endodeoxyribonuclease RuvC [Ignavibacteriae bacterium]|nr:crossover junction endodeoxyribonuclease RuvC [Ignavibacteria bacterium]MBI3365164.1 crossover junction endodeoxyribonuclease RuvC [Ignavibacteriota bacterium]
MVILGVDPGTLITGYGVIETRGTGIRVIICDAITNDSATAMPERLKLIHDILSSVIDRFHPDELALETAFYGKNAQSALKLGHARGVAMLAAVNHGIPTYEYSPREVKKAIVGTGTASKQQVQYMIKSLLHMKESPKRYDVTDALAVAVCHMHRRLVKRSNGTFKSWKTFLSAHPEKVLSPFRS